MALVVTISPESHYHQVQTHHSSETSSPVVDRGRSPLVRKPGEGESRLYLCHPVRTRRRSHLGSENLGATIGEAAELKAEQHRGF